MAHPSPLREVFVNAGAVLAAYGPAGAAAIDVVATFGPVALEYAAIRKHCGLMDLPDRGLVRVTGADRMDFLNRMLTQELKGLEPGQVRKSFWLNRKGRVDADVRVIAMADHVLLEVDALAAGRVAGSLAGYVISEDVVVADVTEQAHQLGLHGPTAGRAIELALDGGSGLWTDMANATAKAVTIAKATVVVVRDDCCGEAGFQFIGAADAMAGVARRLIEVGHDPTHGQGVAVAQAERTSPASQVRLLPVGWHAFNVARIEAGMPWFNIDFGPDSLPVETGVLHARVSFAKGCYLGQEVVARMHARGAMKQTLVAIRFDSVPESKEPGQEPTEPQAILPEAGTALAVAGDAEVAGAITSSACSPMLGMAPICFAQVRASACKAGTELFAEVGGVRVHGVVQATLRFWPT